MMPDGASKVLGRIENAGIRFDKVEVGKVDSTLVYAMTFGNKAATPLLLIHGSPGDWSAWENIIMNDSIRESYFIIAVDRPGYGNTTVEAKQSLADQSKAIWSVIAYLELDKKIVVAGHSYGGAVAEQLLVEGDSLFSQAVLVASTSSPELMKPRWYNKLANWILIDKMLSEELKSSNYEMLGLTSSLASLEPSLNSITTPIIFILGEEDILVPFETADYFKKTKSTGVKFILIEDLNHFIPWSDPDLITDVLLNKSNY